VSTTLLSSDSSFVDAAGHRLGFCARTRITDTGRVHQRQIRLKVPEIVEITGLFRVPR